MSFLWKDFIVKYILGQSYRNLAQQRYQNSTNEVIIIEKDSEFRNWLKIPHSDKWHNSGTLEFYGDFFSKFQQVSPGDTLQNLLVASCSECKVSNQTLSKSFLAKGTWMRLKLARNVRVWQNCKVFSDKIYSCLLYIYLCRIFNFNLHLIVLCFRKKGMSQPTYVL